VDKPGGHDAEEVKKPLHRRMRQQNSNPVQTDPSTAVR
jgi:hypothetical protein